MATAIASDTCAHSAPRLPDLSHCTASKANRSSLASRPEITQVIYHSLFFEAAPTKFPGNQDLAARLKECGLRVSEKGDRSGAYSAASLAVFVKQVKSQAIDTIMDCARTVHERVSEENGNTRKLLARLSAPLPADGVFGPGSSQARRAAFVAAIRHKLIGGEEGPYLADALLFKVLAAEMLERLFQIPSPPGAAAIAAMTPFAKRFVLLERWGLERMYFTDRFQTPFTWLEARQDFLDRKRKLGSEERFTPDVITMCAPWLFQTITRVTSHRAQNDIAPMILECLDLTFDTSKRKNWSEPSVRHAFYQDLMAEAREPGDPRSVPVRSLINDHGCGLLGYYTGTAGKRARSTAAEAFLRLLSEFHCGGVLPLHRDHILATRSVLERQRLGLRYCDPAKSTQYYTAAMGYGERTRTSGILAALERTLAERFEQSTPTAQIADEFGVGRRGIEALRAHYFARRGEDGASFFLRGPDNHVPPDAEMKPRWDMLTYRELCDGIMNDQMTCCLLAGALPGKPAPRKLAYQPEELGALAAELRALQVSVDAGDEGAVLLQIANVELALKQLPAEVEMKATAERRGQQGDIHYFFTKQRLELLLAATSQMKEELDERHYWPTREERQPEVG